MSANVNPGFIIRNLLIADLQSAYNYDSDFVGTHYN